MNARPHTNKAQRNPLCSLTLDCDLKPHVRIDRRSDIGCDASTLIDRHRRLDGRVGRDGRLEHEPDVGCGELGCETAGQSCRLSGDDRPAIKARRSARRGADPHRLRDARWAVGDGSRGLRPSFIPARRGLDHDVDAQSTPKVDDCRHVNALVRVGDLGESVAIGALPRDGHVVSGRLVHLRLDGSKLLTHVRLSSDRRRLDERGRGQRHSSEQEHGDDGRTDDADHRHASAADPSPQDAPLLTAAPPVAVPLPPVTSDGVRAPVRASRGAAAPPEVGEGASRLVSRRVPASIARIRPIGP